MSVSYLSHTFQNSPYVPPVDLNVMAKVLSYKQSSFDATAEKVQGQLDTIASTDLMKGVDKDYVNTKLNNIVNNVNSLGGVDLSDYNISNQITGYASSIYNDDRVISAISSTKRARALMSSYDRMKSDPKLMKYYSEANEYNDNKHLSQWMNDPTPGASYSGPSAATRYYDYNTDFQKALKDVKAHKGVELTVDGFYINKVTKETLSENEVMSMARDLLTPVQRDQMQRDATYLYEGKLKYGEGDLVNKAVSSKVQELDYNKQLVSTLEHNVALETDPKAKSQLNLALKQRRDYVNALQQQLPQAKQTYSNIYRNNPNELMYKVYSDDYFRGLGARYAVHSEDRNVTTNMPAVNAYNQKQQNYRQTRELNAAEKINQDRMANAKDLKWMELLADDKAEIDPATGKPKLKDKNAASATPDIYELQPNQTPDMGDVEQHYIPQANTRIAEIDAEISQKKSSYLSSILSQDPNTQRLLSDMSYDFNKDGKVTLDDFQGNVAMVRRSQTSDANSVLDNLKNNIKTLTNQTRDKDKTQTQILSERYEKVSSGGVPAYNLIKNPKAQRIIATALQAFDNLAEGKPIAITKFPEGTSDLVEQINLLNAEKSTLGKQINDFTQLGKNTFEIPQFSDKAFSVDDKTQKSKSMGLAKSYLIREANLGVTPDDINVLSIGKDENGKGYKITIQQSNGKSGNKKEYMQKSININNSVAKLFDIEEGPYSTINKVVTGMGKDYYAPIQNQYDPQFVAKVRVFKNGDENSYSVQYGQFNPDINDIEYKAFPPVMNGARTNKFSTPAQAYAFGKSVINTFGKDLPAEKQKDLKTAFESRLK